jgi:hypothetical protein
MSIFVPTLLCFCRLHNISYCCRQRYIIEVGEASYGRCRKTWEEFEELYDALEMRYGDKLREVDFPAYNTRYPIRENEAKSLPMDACRVICN